MSIDEAAEPGEELSAAFTRGLHQVVPLQVLEHGQAGRGADRVLRVRVSSHPRRTCLTHGADDALVRDQHGEWRIATTDALGRHENVWHHVPVLDREPSAGPPEAAHDLIGDQEHLIAVADLADALEVPGRGRHRAHGCADHGLGDEARDVLGPVPPDGALQLVGTPQRPARAVLTAIGVGRADLGHVVQHRLVLAPSLRMAAEPRRAQGHAMKPLPAADDQVLLSVAPGQPVLPGKLDSALGDFRAAGEQGDVGQPTRGHLRDGFRQALRGLRLKLRPGNERDFLELLGDCGDHLRDGVPDGGDGAHAARGVDEFSTFGIKQIHAFRAHDRRQVALERGEEARRRRTCCSLNHGRP